MLIAGDVQGGQLTTTTDVENWPADVQGVQGPELMERFMQHAQRFNTRVVSDHRVNAGACLSQPAGVAHNVIQQSDDLELIEINMPADYTTQEGRRL